MMLIFCSLSSIVILKSFVILPLNRPKNGHVLDTQQSYRGSPSTLDTRNLVRLCWVSHLRLMIKQPESQFDYVDKIFVIYLAWKIFFLQSWLFDWEKGTNLSSLEMPGIITNGMCPVLGHRFFDGIGLSEAQRISI